MRNAHLDVGSLWHNNWPEIRGTRLPLGEQWGEAWSDHSFTYRPEHDYAYGLSNPRLRPDVPDEAYATQRSKGDRRKPRRTRKPAARPVQPAVLVSETRILPTYHVAEPVVHPVSGNTHTVRRRIRHKVVETVASGPMQPSMLVSEALADLLCDDMPKRQIDWQ